MLKTILLYTVFVLSVYCKSTSRNEIRDPEKDIDLILELVKLEEDPCVMDPCENKGTCMQTENDFRCICIPPYFGYTCEKDPCMPNPCHNDGVCKLHRDGFTCVCKPPFTGETCELHPCSPNPCENDGKCKQIGDSFECTCNIPYHGDNCELGPCSSNPCKNGGECEEEGDRFKCSCESPFTGTTCEQSPCAPNPCENDGKCYITDKEEFKCFCKDAFSGKRCEKGPCSPNPCKNGGECKRIGNNASCFCPSSYFGEFCEKSSDPCSSNPCLNNGQCRRDGDKYSCECVPPFEGKYCETENTIEPDILMTTSTASQITSSVTYQYTSDVTDSYDQRSSDSSNSTTYEDMSTDGNSTNDDMLTTLEKGFCEQDSDCLNGGTCRNNISCECPPNFGGFRCEVNLICVSLDQSCQIIKAVCVVVNNHAICECPNGTLYHPKSGLCEDICDSRKCVNGKCEIIGRTYKCDCEKGYTGSHCDEKEKVHHDNFILWFIVITSIGLFLCILLIAMLCVICQIKTFISTS